MRAGRQISVHTASIKPSEAPCLVSGVAQGATLRSGALGSWTRAERSSHDALGLITQPPKAFRTGLEQAEAPCCLEFPKEMLVGKGLSYPLAARFSNTSLLAERRIPDCSLDIRCRAGKQEKIQGFIYSFPFTRCVSPEPKGRYFTLHF